MLKDVKKKKRPRPNSTSGPPVPGLFLFRELQEKLSPGHRLLCTYLSDAPQQGVKSLLSGWKSAGGQGRILVVGDEAMLHGEEKVRHLPWPKVGEESTVSGGAGARLGFVAVRVDASSLRPAVLATIVDSIQAGGVLVLVLPHAATWQGLVGPTTGPLAGSALLLEHLCMSLPSCRSWVALDEHLRPLPFSPALQAPHANSKQDDREREKEKGEREEDMGLEELQESLRDTTPVGPLVGLAVTLDQARSLLTFLESASDKSVAATLSLSGAHGRGKSACIGLCLAGAVAYGYSNLFLTAPTPRAAQPIFKFLLRGFDALGYVEGQDYDLIQGEESGVLIRVNVYRDHRQTLQYLYPSDSAKLEQAEVLAVDDAGALGPQVVSRLLGPFLTLVCMSSPQGGVHCAGPSTLSALTQLLQQQSTSTAQQVGSAAAAEVKGSHKAKGERRVHEERWRRAAEAVSALGSTRSLSTLTLEEPVAWRRNDPLEKWAHRALGLSADTYRLKHGTPAPWDCDLFYVDRAALLSGHRLTDNLLHHLLHVYGASDLDRDGDRLASLVGPHDHLMVLLGPQAEAQGRSSGLPDILSVIHLRSGPAGQLGGEGAHSSGLLTVGQRPLHGLEVVQVATHPEVRRMGYGLRAVHMALRYFRGELGGHNEGEGPTGGEKEEEGEEEEEPQEVTLPPKPRSALPPLLAPLDEKGMLRLTPSPSVAWVRCPMGLMRFWAKAGLGCVSLTLPPSHPNGNGTAAMRHEQGVVTMLAGLHSNSTEEEEEEGEEEGEAKEAQACVSDFGCRALRLLSSHYASLPSELALGLVNYYATSAEASAGGGRGPLTADELGFLLSGHDLKRLEMYSRSLVDHHLVSDLLPIVGSLFFQRRLSAVGPLPWLHAAILLGLGLQYKPVEALCAELQMPPHQVLALFNKAVRRLTGAIRAIQEQSLESEMADSAALSNQKSAAMLGGMSSLPLRLEEEMESSAKESLQRLRGQQEELLSSLDVMQYAVKGSLEEWEEVLRDTKSMKKGTVQIKSARQAVGPSKPLWEREQEEEEEGRKKGKKRGNKGQAGGAKRGKAARR